MKGVHPERQSHAILGSVAREQGRWFRPSLPLREVSKASSTRVVKVDNEHQPWRLERAVAQLPEVAVAQAGVWRWMAAGSGDLRVS